MRLSRSSVWLLIGLVLGCARTTPPESPRLEPESTPAVPPETSFTLEDGFQLLTLADFAPFQGEEGTWTESNGMIVCSGQPKGYMHTPKSYRNFTLRCDYRFEPESEAGPPEKSNTGFMIHIQEPHKVWPRSLEVQGRFDEMCSIKSNGGVPELTINDHPAIREQQRLPVGEWNSVEIISKEGALTSYLNGELICISEPGELSEGLLGLQSEGYVVQFRHLRIHEE